jgi:hypothetical protein
LPLERREKAPTAPPPPPIDDTTIRPERGSPCALPIDGSREEWNFLKNEIVCASHYQEAISSEE